MPVLVRSSTSPWLRRTVGGIVFALVAAAGVTACGGIGITSETESTVGGTAAGTADDPIEDGTNPSASADASTASADGGIGAIAYADAGAEAPDTQPYISPLCGTVTACDPDLVSGNGCSASDGDGGAAHGVDASTGPSDGNDGAASLACRVSTSGRNSALVSASACVAGGAGTDGAACAGGDDCSVGFECVGAPGQCRRYCCSGSCSDEKAFCDVQPASGTNAMSVPVCMPVDPCKLLDATSCSSVDTCSVVADDGTTSCVATGTASEGQACDTVHCMAGEICVGKSGSRVCDKLCYVNGTDCSSGKVCTSNATLFEEDPTVGLCTAPQ